MTGSRWHGTITESYGALPFAVWFHGFIERFVATREEAEHLLARIQGKSIYT